MAECWTIVLLCQFAIQATVRAAVQHAPPIPVRSGTADAQRHAFRREESLSVVARAAGTSRPVRGDSEGRARRCVATADGQRHRAWSGRQRDTYRLTSATP